MVGDQRLVEAAIDASARQCATGARWPERPVAVGAAGLGSHMLLRWSAPLDLAALNIRGHVAPVGPLVAADPAQAFISLARCDDGVRLDLVVDPVGLADGADTSTAPATARLTFTRMPGGVAHRLHGDGVDVEVMPDGHGRAEVEVALATRARLVLEPRHEGLS